MLIRAVRWPEKTGDTSLLPTASARDVLTSLRSFPPDRRKSLLGFGNPGNSWWTPFARSQRPLRTEAPGQGSRT